MKTIQLGNTDLQVSRLCLGCMTFGEPTRGNHAWTLPEASSRPLIQQALNAGIQRLLDQRTTARFRQRPGVIAAGRLSKGHTAETETRNLQIGITQLNGFHNGSSGIAHDF